METKTLTNDEKRELAVLRCYKASTTRWMSQREQDRLKELAEKQETAAAAEPSGEEVKP